MLFSGLALDVWEGTFVFPFRLNWKKKEKIKKMLIQRTGGGGEENVGYHFRGGRDRERRLQLDTLHKKSSREYQEEQDSQGSGSWWSSIGNAATS
jgi:hypothetical protein